jgi:diguanylate cyclase (GGDEF)-like protein
VSALLGLIATAVVVAVAGGAAAWPIIARLRRQLAAAAWQARHDPLTGLLNRAGLHAARDAWPHPGPVLVVLLDLDDFKTVNDTYGHDTGDHLLAAVGGRLAEAARLAGGVAARLSGDEFAVLLPQHGGDAGRRVDAVVAPVGAPVDVAVDGTPVRLEPSATAGAVGGDAGDPLAVLLRRADIALYHAKHAGRPYRLYQPGLAMPAPAARGGPRLRDCRGEQQHREGPA